MSDPQAWMKNPSEQHPAPEIDTTVGWHPDEAVDNPNAAWYWAGVARKP